MPKEKTTAGKKGRKRAAPDRAPKKPSLIMQLLMRSPKDTVAGTVALIAVGGIIANAVWLQAGHHPSPMFGKSVVVPMRPAEPLPAAAVPAPSPLPKPRPVETQRGADLDTRLLDQRPVERAHVELRPADPIGNLVKANLTQPSRAAPAQAAAAPARPPAPVPAATRGDPLADLINSTQRVVAVQRALTDFGYGQFKATGNLGPETAAAIQRFERDRKMPVTGQITPRLVKELSAVTGRTIN